MTRRSLMAGIAGLLGGSVVVSRKAPPPEAGVIRRDVVTIRPGTVLRDQVVHAGRVVIGAGALVVGCRFYTHGGGVLTECDFHGQPTRILNCVFDGGKPRFSLRGLRRSLGFA